MSNNKQSRIYQCVELLNRGVNDLGIQTTIINAYEKVVRKNDALKEHIEKLILDLQDKKKIISNLEEEHNLLQRKVDIFIGDINYNENNTLRETNKNLLEISERYKQEINDYKKLTSINLEIKQLAFNRIDMLIEKNVSLEKENEEIKNEIEMLEGAYDYREEELERYKEKHEIAKIIINTNYGLGSNVNEENKKLKQEIDRLNILGGQYQKTFKNNAIVLKDNITLKDENEKLKLKLYSLIHEIETTNLHPFVMEKFLKVINNK